MLYRFCWSEAWRWGWAGEPVTAGDVDVVIKPGQENLRRLHAAPGGPGSAAAEWWRWLT
jgi:hypothetical protein